MKKGPVILKNLIFLLTAFLIVFLTVFLLGRMTPGDPVLRQLSERKSDQPAAIQSISGFKEQYNTVSARMGLDLPLFYFSIYSLAEFPVEAQYPEIFYPNIQRYRLQYGSRFTKDYFTIRDSLVATIPITLISDPEIRRYLRETDKTADLKTLKGLFLNIQTIIIKRTNNPNTYADKIVMLLERTEPLAAWKQLVPVIVWNGFTCQFHRWCMGVFAGDMGVSYKDGNTVFKKIMNALIWTLRINIPAFILVIFISLIVGWLLVFYRGKWFTAFLGVILDILFSMPAFVLGVLLISILSSQGLMQDALIFDTDHDKSFFFRLVHMIGYLAIPVVCIVLPSSAVLGRHVRNLFQVETRKPYVEGHLVRGVPVSIIWTRYIFKNILVSFINDIGRMIPALISGSLIIEVLFNVPGMGRLLFESIMARDWPVLYGIMLITSLLSVGGIFTTNLIIDLLLHRSGTKAKTV